MVDSAAAGGLRGLAPLSSLVEKIIFMSTGYTHKAIFSEVVRGLL
jgi:hypothetical protein